jgi:hypothetical protein
MNGKMETTLYCYRYKVQWLAAPGIRIKWRICQDTLYIHYIYLYVYVCGCK